MKNELLFNCSIFKVYCSSSFFEKTFDFPPPGPDLICNNGLFINELWYLVV